MISRPTPHCVRPSKRWRCTWQPTAWNGWRCRASVSRQSQSTQWRPLPGAHKPLPRLSPVSMILRCIDVFPINRSKWNHFHSKFRLNTLDLFWPINGKHIHSTVHGRLLLVLTLLGCSLRCWPCYFNDLSSCWFYRLFYLLFWHFLNQSLLGAAGCGLDGLRWSDSKNGVEMTSFCAILHYQQQIIYQDKHVLL